MRGLSGKRIWILVLATALAGIGYVGWAVVDGLNAISSLQPGMSELRSPSGGFLYLHRQSYFGKPAELFISRNNDLCEPYDRWHDFKISDPVHGASDSPLLISSSDNSIIVHAPNKPTRPWLSGSPELKLNFDPITAEQYAAYASPDNTSVILPPGWQRVEVPFEHNTCAL